jgi:hypothetical protein
VDFAVGHQRLYVPHAAKRIRQRPGPAKPPTRSPRLRSRNNSARVKDSAEQSDYTPPVPFAPPEIRAPGSRILSRPRWDTPKVLASLLRFLGLSQDEPRSPPKPMRQCESDAARPAGSVAAKAGGEGGAVMSEIEQAGPAQYYMPAGVSRESHRLVDGKGWRITQSPSPWSS